MPEPTTDTVAAGRVRITDEAVAQVIGHTVLSCYGIVGMAAKSLARGVAQLLGRDSLTQGIEVQRDGEAVRIDLYVVLEYGLNLAEVAASVRSRVVYEVERLTGLHVEDVQIHIQGVRNR